MRDSSLVSLLVGLVIGGALGSVLAVKAAGRRPAATPPPEQVAAEPAESEELTRLREEKRRLGAQLDRALADLRPATPSSPAPAAEETRNPFAETGKWLAKLMDPSKRGASLPMDNILDLMRQVGEISKRRGVPVDEAMLTPDGLPLLLRATFDACEPPLDAEENRRLREVLAESALDWEALQPRRAGMSLLEERLELLRGIARTRDDLAAAFSAVHAEVAKKTITVGFGLGETSGVSFFHATGKREDVVEQLRAHWTTALHLDALQSPALGPIIEEFVKDAPWDSAGADPVGEEIQRTAALLAAQKKIAGTLGLTAAQAEALRNWNVHYSCRVAAEGEAK